MLISKFYSWLNDTEWIYIVIPLWTIYASLRKMYHIIVYLIILLLWYPSMVNSFLNACLILCVSINHIFWVKHYKYFSIYNDLIIIFLFWIYFYSVKPKICSDLWCHYTFYNFLSCNFLFTRNLAPLYFGDELQLPNNLFRCRHLNLKKVDFISI